MEKKLLIPCNIIKSLMFKYNTGLNQLGKIIIDAMGEKSENELESWINLLKEEEKHILPQVLKLIGSPNIIVDIGIVIDGDALIRTWVVSNGVDHGFVGINESGILEINIIEDMTNLINSLIVYLDMGVPAGDTNIAFKVDLEDMSVLLSLIDLHQRKKYSGMLDHTWLGEEMFVDDIKYFYEDSVKNPDVRWLLSFSLNQFYVNQKNIDIENSLQKLQRLNILERKNDAWKFTPQGRFFADSCINRISQMSLSVIDADNEARLQKTECVLVRSHRMLWLFMVDPSENTVIITTLSYDKAGEFFNGLFSTEGLPSKVELGTESIENKVNLNNIEIIKENTVNRRRYIAKFCTNCGSAIKPNQKFCSKCGKKLNN